MPDKNNPLPAADGSSKSQKDKDPNDVIKAHNEADKDISKDPDFTEGSPNDDLDEGESARLGEDVSGII